MECSSIFEDFISNCQDEIIVNANLEPGENYKWVITAPNGSEYEGEFTADVYTGAGVIEVADLPAGLLNQYAGTFFLQLFDTPYQCRKVNFVIGKSVDTIAFNVRPGTAIKPNLGCALT